MRRLSKLRNKLVEGVVGLILLGGATAYAVDAPAAKWYDTIGMSGYLEGSYVGNLSAPQKPLANAATPNVDRLFDQETNSFNLNAFHMQIAKPVGDEGYGFTAKLH